MAQNVGGFDRTARLALGAVLLVVGIAGVAELVSTGLTVGAVLALVGVVMLGTGLTRTCLLYEFIGVDTSN